MKPLSHYFAVCKGLTREAFVQRYPGPFLVHSSRTGGALQVTSGGRTIDSVVVDDTGGAGPDEEADVLTVFTVQQFAPKAPALTVGSDPSSSIRVPAASVSRLHARLVRGPEGWRVEDAGSSVGTWANGEALEPAVVRDLDPGDRVSLGALDLTFYPSSHFYDFVIQMQGGRPD